jgi:hypothetical protein
LIRVQNVKRDLTVPLSLILIVGTVLIGSALGMPRTITAEDPLHFQILFAVIFIAAIRGSVLWFQTLIHATKYAAEDNRVAAVMAHLLLGPIMSYAYYFTTGPSMRAGAE